MKVSSAAWSPGHAASWVARFAAVYFFLRAFHIEARGALGAALTRFPSCRELLDAPAVHSRRSRCPAGGPRLRARGKRERRAHCVSFSVGMQVATVLANVVGGLRRDRADAGDAALAFASAGGQRRRRVPRPLWQRQRPPGSQPPCDLRQGSSSVNGFDRTPSASDLSSPTTRALPVKNAIESYGWSSAGRRKQCRARCRLRGGCRGGSGRPARARGSRRLPSRSPPGVAGWHIEPQIDGAERPERGIIIRDKDGRLAPPVHALESSEGMIAASWSGRSGAAGGGNTPQPSPISGRTWRTPSSTSSKSRKQGRTSTARGCTASCRGFSTPFTRRPSLRSGSSRRAGPEVVHEELVDSLVQARDATAQISAGLSDGDVGLRRALAAGMAGAVSQVPPRPPACARATLRPDPLRSTGRFSGARGRIPRPLRSPPPLWSSWGRSSSRPAPCSRPGRSRRPASRCSPAASSSFDPRRA